MKVHEVKGHRPSVTTKFYVISLYDSTARHVAAKHKKKAFVIFTRIIMYSPVKMTLYEYYTYNFILLTYVILYSVFYFVCFILSD